MAEQTFRHQFLLAMPGLDDGIFAGTLIYLCEHNAEGAMGLIVNRPTDMTLAELLGQLHLDPPAHAIDIPVLDGGPVGPERGFVLHSDDRRFEGSIDVGAGLVLSVSQSALAAIADGSGPAHFLVALGFAGWGAGQLEQEVLANTWLTCPAYATVLFDAPFPDRVHRAAAALGIDFNQLSGQAGHA